MTESPTDLSPEERHRMNFMGLVLFLRQMASELVHQGQLEEARGLVDSLESLQAKSKGNTDAEEDHLLENVLYELRMAVVKGPPEPAPSEETGSDTEASSDG